MRNRYNSGRIRTPDQCTDSVLSTWRSAISRAGALSGPRAPARSGRHATTTAIRARGHTMPIHLLHSDGGQAFALFAIIIGGICVRYWRITLSIAAALLIGSALIALSVITDLHIAHQVTMYLRDLGRIG